MNRFLLGIAAVISLAGLGALSPLLANSDSQPASSAGVKLPAGYRDWAMISVARVGAPVNDLRAKLGNEAAIKAFRAGTRPFPDGTTIVRLAYRAVASEENNAVFRAAAEQQGLAPEQIAKLLEGSVVAGPAVNVQVMVKDKKKYASTGGWGFAQFNDGKPADETVNKTCFSCHVPVKDQDFVFTRYVP